MLFLHVVFNIYIYIYTEPLVTRIHTHIYIYTVYKDIWYVCVLYIYI